MQATQARGHIWNSAVAVAADLALALDLRLVIAHGYLPAVSEAAIPAASGVLPIEAERLSAKAKRNGSEALDRAETVVSTELRARRKLVAGDPAGILAELAGPEPAAMVVVGSRGHRPLKAALTGSVSSAVLGAAGVPVVVVTAAAAVGGQPHPARKAGLPARAAVPPSSRFAFPQRKRKTHGAQPSAGGQIGR